MLNRSVRRPQQICRAPEALIRTKVHRQTKAKDSLPSQKRRTRHFRVINLGRAADIFRLVAFSASVRKPLLGRKARLQESRQQRRTYSRLVSPG
jgi:hypothetical protein